MRLYNHGKKIQILLYQRRLSRTECVSCGYFKNIERQRRSLHITPSETRGREVKTTPQLRRS